MRVPDSDSFLKRIGKYEEVEEKDGGTRSVQESQLSAIEQKIHNGAHRVLVCE